jgi:cardiolipin synthase
VDIASIWWWAAPPLEAAWVLGSAVYIVLQRRSAAATLAWMLALALLPIVGILVYYVFGPRRYERRKERRLRAQTAVRRDLVHDVAELVDLPGRLRATMALGEAAVGLAARPRRADVRLFFDGASKYRAVTEAVREARQHVHVEYYIWEPDAVGSALRDALCERARAGVEVRVLVDGFGSSKAHDRFWAPLVEAGGQVRRFNALSLSRWRPRMANFRTHRKLVVVDASIGFTGGMNVSEVHSAEYLGDDAWRDTHLELRGAAVKGLQLVFFEDWHYSGGDVPEVAPYLTGNVERGAGAHLVQVVSSGPDEGMDAIHKLFVSTIASAETRVWLTTPYFVPDEPILDALSIAALRGADVRILVPEEGDTALVAAAARSYYPELLEAGVRIFELARPVLHAKTLVIDDELAIVGTANLDSRSFRLNFEVVVAMFARDINAELGAAFERDLARSREVTSESLESTTFLARLGSSAARLLSPLL